MKYVFRALTIVSMLAALIIQLIEGEASIPLMLLWFALINAFAEREFKD